jgi:polyhydroxybutyrate depolymerase
MSAIRPVWRALLIGSLVLGAAGSAGPTASTAATLPPAATCRDLVPGDHTIHVDVDGTMRDALIHVPPAAAAAGARLPLVIGFHGYSASDTQLAASAQLGPIADTDGFVVVFPQGTGGVPSWYWPGGPAAPPAGVDDIRFVEVLLDLASAQGCLDDQRVVVMGHSMGGGMADAVACELTPRIAGVVEVSAVRFGSPCAPARPIPVVALHALDDPVLPYAGGRIPWTPASYPAVLPVEQAMAGWAARDGCSGSPVTSDDADGGSILSWQDCVAPVVLHRRVRGGHGYPSLASELVREMVRGTGDVPMASAGPEWSQR